MKYNKETIQTLEIPDDVKLDLTELFTSVEEQETEITRIRAELRDADKVVKAKPKLDAELQKKQTLIDELNAKLNAALKPSDKIDIQEQGDDNDFSSPFKVVHDFASSLFGTSEPKTEE